jgi:hypothetical protein
MTTSELVKKLMDAGANSEVVQIVLEYLEQGAAAAKAARRRNRKKAEVVRVVK